MRTLTALVAPAAMMMLGACAGVPNDTDPFAGASGEETVQVEVQNQNWSDMRIYARRDGGPRVRLGSVGSLSSERFRLPRSVMSGSARILLEADPIAGRGIYRTDPISLHGGETIRVNLRNHLAVSGYSVIGR